MRSQRRDLLLFICGVFFLGAAREFARLLVNLRLREVGFTDAAIGRAVAAHQLGMMLAALPVAVLLGRLPIRLLLILSTLLASTGMWILSASSIEILAWTGQFLLGVALAIPFVSSFPFILERARRSRRTLWIGAVPATFSLSGVLASPLAGWWAERFSIAHSIALGAVVALAALPFFAALRAARPMPRSESRFGFLRPARRLLTIGFLTGVGTGLCVPFLNLLLQDQASFDALSIGQVFAFSHLFVVAGSLLASSYERRLGTRRGLVVGEVALGLVILSMGVCSWRPVLVAAVILRGIPMAATFALYKKAVLECVPAENRRHVAGASSFLWNGSLVMGGLLGGIVLEAAGFSVLLGLAAGVLFLAGVLAGRA